jgi:MerR family transcriptional regulator, repressor of the yfmOP operon
MTAIADKMLRIGEVAELTGTTPRTIRYYEEIGLLPGAEDRVQGKHRCYSLQDIERIKEIVRLRDLLGLSLDQLRALLEAEAARAELRREYQDADDPETRKRILNQSLGHIGTQLELVQGRLLELQQLEQELVDKRRSVRGKLRELEQ